MEVGVYGLTRGTCFVARRLEVVAVAGPLWMDFTVCFGWGGFLRVCVCMCVFSDFIFVERTRPAESTYEADLPHLPHY